MSFVGYLVETVVKMFLIAGVALAGIGLGKTLRDKKSSK